MSLNQRGRAKHFDTAIRIRLPWLIRCLLFILFLSPGLNVRGEAFTELYGFLSAWNPQAGLIQGTNGILYGTTTGGGDYGYGMVFQMTTNGLLTPMVSFSVTNGAAPQARLLQTADGNLFGTTYYGGTNAILGMGYGTIFKVSPAGTLTSMFSFNGTNGANPTAGLVQAWDGNLYGTTLNGGTKGFGTIFKISTNGSFSTVLSFVGTNGTYPQAALIPGTNQSLFGSTSRGGSSFRGFGSGDGTIFSLSTNGTLTIMTNLSTLTGTQPLAELAQGADGNFFGTTSFYGPGGKGSLFKLSAGGKFTYFTNTGSFGSGLASGNDGALYGTSSDAVFKITTNGTLSYVAQFYQTNGSTPVGTLLAGMDGNFYGVTSAGGAHDCGTIYKVSPAGMITTLTSFSNPAGAEPHADLIQGNDGTFYGTTRFGGEYNLGTIFRVGTNGTLFTMVSFNGINGSSPLAGLLQATDGWLYGAASQGGASNGGTLFRVATNGQLEVLIDFKGTNGAFPAGGLIQGRDGNFYGTSEGGGQGHGTVFRFSTNGTLSLLAVFDSSNTGTEPVARLMQAADGSFWGTAAYGGPTGDGSAFQVKTNGTLSVNPFSNYHGSSVYLDGTQPFSSLIEGKDGNIYGTTSASGLNGVGAVFKVIPGIAGGYIAQFGYDHGDTPLAGLIMGTDGMFYGTTSAGGTKGFGTIFRLNPGGTLNVLYAFDRIHGASSQATLVQAADGCFYGTTTTGGSRGGGNIFRLDFRPQIQGISRTNSTNKLQWNAIVGLRYQVQYKQDLNLPNWSNLSASFSATNSTATALDPSGATTRFYRVLLLP